MERIRGIAVLLALGPAVAIGADPTTNCDPLEGPVDAKACAGHWANQSASVDATFCMDPDVPCSDAIATKLRARAKINEGNKTFCSRLLRSTFQYVAFQSSTQFSASETSVFVQAVTGEGRVTREDSNIARVDIDNDGKPEVILQIFTAAPNYRACDYPVYIQLHEDGAHIKQGNLNNLMKTPSQCPVSFAPFRYRGKTYFEVREWSSFVRTRLQLLSQVLMIDGQGVQSVCEFSY